MTDVRWSNNVFFEQPKHRVPNLTLTLKITNSVKMSSRSRVNGRPSKDAISVTG